MMEQMMMMQMMRPPAPPPPPAVLEQAAPASSGRVKQQSQNDLSLGVAKYRNTGVNTGSAGGSATGLGISM
jgi:hypothetical protein